MHGQADATKRIIYPASWLIIMALSLWLWSNQKIIVRTVVGPLTKVGEQRCRKQVWGGRGGRF